MYGEGKNLRYIIGIAAVIILLFLVIFLIVRSGGNEPKVPETQKALTSYTNDSTVTITQTIVGPIVAAENHRETQIRVTNTGATIDVIKGYEGSVIDSRSYPMSTDSFSEFLNALEKAGYTKGNTDKALANDEGYCPTGQRYIFEVTQGNNTVQRFWATSCRGTKTYRGNLALTNNLFQAQIPDYGQITANTGTSTNAGLIGI